MDRHYLPPRNQRHFHEYRCIICHSVLETRRSMRPRTEYVPTDRCYNCISEISYSLATHDETSSQEFLQTMLPVAQAAERIANKISEASDQPACSRPWSPTAIDVAPEPDDETHTEPSLYDETPEERGERFRNSRAIGDSQTTSPDYLPATLSYSPELDEFQLELSQSDASVSETYVHAYEFDAFSREASEFDVSELDAPEGDAHPADNAPAPHQSPNETEEGLNTIRGL